ncbi:phenoloxidase-activating factor 2-like [Drosophila eugracilis]|uniref:phenoloxidase-activating factor 2-like n=1 Tax=Drosophila eugracilis TaxID=29029 RepID=UPI0007E806DC|nr:phenoloxidase-activating factor 2-like [Drosophila eugracilis]
MVHLRGKLLILCLILATCLSQGQAHYWFQNQPQVQQQAQNQNLKYSIYQYDNGLQSCGGLKDYVCVPKRQCRTQMTFRDMIGGNMGCYTTSTCCHKSKILTDTIDVIPLRANNDCGVVNFGSGRGGISNLEDMAQESEITWMVALLKASSSEYVAGGSLISSHIVITSQKNIESMMASDIVVRAGEWDFKTTTEQFPHVDINVLEIKRHPGFNYQTKGNNVALLFLEKSFKKAPHINPICLPRAPKTFDLNKCIFTGWGKKSFEDTTYMNVMKKISMPVVKRGTCQQILRQFEPDFVLDNSLMCAGGESEKDSCTGDGGSPLACPLKENPQRYELAGIVNFGADCGMEGIPGVYTNVANIIDWIRQETDNVPEPPEEIYAPTFSPIQFIIPDADKNSRSEIPNSNENIGTLYGRAENNWNGVEKPKTADDNTYDMTRFFSSTMDYKFV